MGPRSKSRKRKYRQEHTQAAALADLVSQAGRDEESGSKRNHADGDANEAGDADGNAANAASTTTTATTTDANTHDDSGSDWQVVAPRPLKQKRLEPDRVSMLYPQITPMPSCRLHSFVSLENVRTLALYVLSDGTGPTWVAVRNRLAIRKVVFLLVPGLEMGLFDGSIDLDAHSPTSESADDSAPVATTSSSDRDAAKAIRSFAPVDPDEYYPRKLVRGRLEPELQPLADIFPHVWHILAGGDATANRLHSPINTLLSIPLNSKNRDKTKKPIKSFPTPVTTLVMSRQALCENEYVLHPAYIADADVDQYRQSRAERGQSSSDGWVDTAVRSLEDGNMEVRNAAAGLSFGHPVLAIDCEMCVTTTDAKALTRISIVDWDLKVLMDELVMPEDPIVNYLTEYSGITAEKLAGVTTTLADIQARLLELISPETILVGHSLNSDLSAMKMTHPFVVDTAVVYPHPRGFPLKSSLKFLATNHLKKDVQVHGGSTGHDSIEDARTAMELVKMKCEKGLQFASQEATSESMFAKMAKSPRPNYLSTEPNKKEHRKGGYVDWGDGTGALGALAEVRIGCTSDREVVDGLIKAVTGPDDVDFAWGRMRELEAVRGWWTSSRSPEMDRLRVDIVDRFARQAEHARGDGNKNKSEGESKSDEATPKEHKNSSSGLEKSGETDTTAAATQAGAATVTTEVEATPQGSALPSPVPSSLAVPSPSQAETPQPATPASTTAGPTGTTDTTDTAASSSPDSAAPTGPSAAKLALAGTVNEIERLYASLPQYTALFVLSGSGDPRELSRMKTMFHDFKAEYQTAKWDQLKTKWTDVEEQQCRTAFLRARKGCGLFVVK